MFVIDLVFALIFAIVLMVLLLSVFGWRYPGREDGGAAALFLFVVFFFVVWAIAAWVTPFGPTLWGGHWLPFLVSGLLVALLILAVAVPTRPATPAYEQEAADTAATVVFGVFFWFLILVALSAIVIRYVW